MLTSNAASEKYQKIWKDALSVLAYKNIDPTLYNIYIRNTFLYTVEDRNRYIVGVQSKFAKELLIKEVLVLFENVCSTLAKESIKIEFCEQKQLIKYESSIQQQTKTPQQQHYTFANFVVGKTNHEAYTACYNLVKNLQHNEPSLFNPLFIYAPHGYGKTHLLKSIEHELSGGNLKVKYLTANDFSTLIASLVHKNHETFIKFKRSFDTYDVLLLDDIQWFSTRVKTNEIFFDIFHDLISANKQLVISSATLINDLMGFQPAMISRLKQGLCLNIKQYDVNVICNIIKFKMLQLNKSIILNETIINYIVQHFTKDIRQLEGVLKNIIFSCTLNDLKQPQLIDIQQIINIHKTTKHYQDSLTIDTIKKVVADAYALNIRDLHSKNQSRNFAIARHVAMFLIRSLKNHTFKEISLAFGKKDHATVMSACRRIDTLIKQDVLFKEQIKKLKEKCINI